MEDEEEEEKEVAAAAKEERSEGAEPIAQKSRAIFMHKWI